MKLTGIFGIPYVDILQNDKWPNYFGKYENQRWARWDTYSCWFLGGCINPLETQFEWLWKHNLFSQEAKDFFTSNGYIDADNDFSFSERFGEILSSVKDTGSSPSVGNWVIQKYGLLPRSMLTYTIDESNKFYTQEQFNADYFNPLAVTQAMKDLAIQVLKYVNIDFQQIGSSWITPKPVTLKSALLQATLSIGVPAHAPGWNSVQVQWDGSKEADHEVELYDYVDGDPFPYKIYDQYEPHLKELSADYFIATCHQFVVTVKPLPNAQIAPTAPLNWLQRLWAAVVAFARANPSFQAKT